MSSTFSAALECSVSASNERECIQSHSARKIPPASAYSDTIGPRFQFTMMSANSHQLDWVVELTSSQVGSHASLTAPQPGDAITPLIYGPRCCESSLKSDLIGSLLRTSLESDMTALTQCAVISKTGITPSGRSISILRYRRDSVAAFDSSGWPTPTETANHDAPSMAKWPAYARYQRSVSRTTARLWEWMMDFPPGWLDCICSETPSPPPSPSSSDAP